MTLTMRFPAVSLLAVLAYGQSGAPAPHLQFVPQTGHSAALSGIFETPDGAWLITTSADGSIKIWQSGNKHQLAATIPAHAGAVRSAALHPSGTFIATAGDDHTVRVWRIPQGTLAWQKSVPGGFQISVSWSGDGKWLAVANEQVTIVSRDGRTSLPIEVASPATSVAFSNSLLAVSQLDSRIAIFDLTDAGQPKLVRNLTHPQADQLVLGRKQIVSIGGGTAIVWDLATGATLQSFALTAGAAVAFDEERQRLAVAESGQIRLLTLGNNPSDTVLRTNDVVTALTFARNGDLLAGGFSGGVGIVSPAKAPVPLLSAAGSGLIYAEFTGHNRLDAISSGPDGIAIGSFDSLRPMVTISAGLLTSRIARPLKSGAWIATVSPLELNVIDRTTRAPVRTIKTQNIDAWPFACDGISVCAWTSNRQISSADFQDASGTEWNVPSGDAPVTALAVKGGVVAAVAAGPVVRFWSRSEHRELDPIRLRVPADASSTGSDPFIQMLQSRKLFLPQTGMVTAIALDDQGAKLAAGNNTEIAICEVDHSDRCFRTPVDASPTALVLRGSKVIWADTRLRLREWDSTSSVPPVLIAELTGIAHELSFSDDGRFAAVVLESGILELVDLAAKSVSASLMQGSDFWLAATPGGLFDASEGGWSKALWRIDQPSPTLLPIETYFRDFFHPDLVSDILAGQKINSPRPTAGPRKLPRVTIREQSHTPEKLVLSPNGMETIPASIRINIHAAPGATGSKVVDLRVARNGIVVRHFPGEWRADQDITVELLPGPGEIRAYAFDETGLKSEDSVIPIPLEGFGYQALQPVLRILAVGINRYKNEAFNLRFAKADAELVSEVLSKPPQQLNQMLQRLNDLSNQNMLSGPRQGEVLPRSVEVTLLTDEKATRSGILSAISAIRQSSRPGDAVLIWYAGHGVAVGDRYVLLPHDMAIAGTPADAARTPPTPILSSGITDLDLEAALLDLDASFIGIVLDSCQSGKILEGDRPRGPLNGSGFARLVYEKGIFLLAASQSFELAQEDNRCGHGLLSCALLVEGLQQSKADFDPLDARIDIAEWFRYAALRVPGLAHPGGDADRGFVFRPAAQPLAEAVQVPRFVPRASTASSKLVIDVLRK